MTVCSVGSGVNEPPLNELRRNSVALPTSTYFWHCAHPRSKTSTAKMRVHCACRMAAAVTSTNRAALLSTGPKHQAQKLRNKSYVVMNTHI